VVQAHAVRAPVPYDKNVNHAVTGIAKPEAHPMMVSALFTEAETERGLDRLGAPDASATQCAAPAT
jgi:hypothetical protein